MNINVLENKVRKIEDILKTKGEGVVTFAVRYGHEDEDFRKQHDGYLANGGNPDALFVSITKYAV